MTCPCWTSLAEELSEATSGADISGDTGLLAVSEQAASAASAASGTSVRRKDIERILLETERESALTGRDERE
jgi:hypothetical protein